MYSYKIMGGIMITFILEYWVEFFFGLLISGLLLVYHKIEKHTKTAIATKNGMKILLKNEIIKEYQKVYKRECITIYEKSIIMDLYKEYKNLGGNGVIEDIIHDVNEIPLKENCGGD